MKTFDDYLDLLKRLKMQEDWSTMYDELFSVKWEDILVSSNDEELSRAYDTLIGYYSVLYNTFDAVCDVDSEGKPVDTPVSRMLHYIHVINTNIIEGKYRESKRNN